MKTGASGVWLVVYMCTSLQTADAVEQLLHSEGFLVRRREVLSSGMVELCVLESEAQEARKMLVEKGL